MDTQWFDIDYMEEYIDFTINSTTWEDLPTFYQAVNAFAELEIKEFLGGSLTRSVGGSDISEQRILY